MAEDTATIDAPATEPVVEPTTEPTTELSALVSSDGTFSENWMLNLDEDLQANSKMKQFKDLNSMARSFDSAERMIGKDKIAKPSETTTDEEWKEWFRLSGTPEDPNDYNLSKPENLPDELYDEEFVNKARAFFHEINLTKTQAEKLFAFHNDINLGSIQFNETAAEVTLKETEDFFHGEYGNAYDQKMHQGNRAINEGVQSNEEMQSRIVNMKLQDGSNLGANRDFIQMMNTIGERRNEGSPANVQAKSIDTPDEIQGKIQTLMTTEAFNNKHHPEHEITMKKVDMLYEEKHAVA